jgi:hypothetical protein
MLKSRMLGNPLVRFWEGQGGNLAGAPCLLDTKEILRSHPSGADGVVPSPNHFKNAIRQAFARVTTPSVRSKDASRNLLGAQPPLLT